MTGGVGIGSSAEGVREMMRYERRSFESVRGPLRYPSINSKERWKGDEWRKGQTTDISLRPKTKTKQLSPNESGTHRLSTARGNRAHARPRQEHSRVMWAV